MASLRWNFGVNNFMTYLTGNLTTGRYEQQRIADLGLGHNAIDAGGAYTYFDQKTGREFSATLGFTYNFENEHTNYQNGIDMHLDWSASQFLTSGKSESLAIGTINCPATAAQATASAASSREWSESDRRSAMSFQSAKLKPQGLRRICRTEQARWLERLAYFRDYTGCAR
jgi:Putative MetA-pathway of phenol degradation